MSYQVLARKWRPSNFEQVVGQAHVLQSLINALEQQRLHHAYLFSGTRGVGKTSIARLLAKALNCEQGVSATPCGECSSCTEIAQGNFVDLIEIDAASKTKVEDTRDILDNVQYKPTRGRYKVYLIDEVHMLSRSSFNALLKTLEEPPEHVKFLFATTETQKLPVTILSRCLQFNLKALSVNAIEQQLNHILSKESVNFDDGALTMLATAADGSMRDALSLTEQAISYSDSALTQHDVQLMLGTLDPNYSLKILNTVVSKDTEAVFSLLEEINAFAPDYDKLLKQLALDLHFASMAKVVKQSVRLSSQPELLWQLASNVESELLQLLYSIVLQGRKELPWAADPRSGFEMVILRLLAFLPAQKKNLTAADLDGLKGSVQATEPEVNPETDTEGEIEAESSVQHRQLASLEQQQASLVSQAATIKEKSQTAIAKEHVIGNPHQHQNVANSLPEKSPASPVSTLSAKTPSPENTNVRSALPSIEQVTPQSQHDFSEEELLNMSMAMAHSDDDDQAPQHYEVQSLSQSPAPSPSREPISTGPIAGIDQFLKARDSLKKKAKPTESATPKEQTVKKPAAVEPSPSAKVLLPVVESSILMTPVVVAPMIASNNETEEIQGVVGQVTPLPDSAQPKLEEGHSAALVEDPATLLAPNTDDYWSNLLDSMAVGGRIRQLGIHSSYEIEKNTVTLTLAAPHRHLGVETAVQTMQKNLSLALELPIELVVNIGEGIQKTPFTIAQELHVLRLNLATDCIAQDSVIVEFIEKFGANVDQESIKYRTIKAIN